VRELKNVIERAVYRSNDMQIGTDDLIFDPFAQFEGYLPASAPASSSESQARGDGTTKAPLPAEAPAGSTVFDLSRPFHDCIRDIELTMLRRALDESKYNQRKAADLLKMTYHQFRGLYRKYQDDVSN
jgi:psp operon transcriptional activator